jgi:hypothetical protein
MVNGRRPATRQREVGTPVESTGPLRIFITLLPESPLPQRERVAGKGNWFFEARLTT